ncbi:MAG: tetratricopeptide repeat protein [Deltaproteobacteria bacterium]|nr:tetratricopeptide repeat protein [Deltaproteobacteria bacterium]
MGKVIKLNASRPAVDEETRMKMRRFLENELTWAEVEGMTASQARQISRIGCDLAARGRLNDARIIFEGLVAGNPKDTSALAALGAVYQRLQRRAEALECFDKAVALFPANIIALANRGELRLRGGDAGGIEDLARAVEVDAKGVSAAGRRARTLLAALARSKPATQQARMAVGR